MKSRYFNLPGIVVWLLTSCQSTSTDQELINIVDSYFIDNPIDSDLQNKALKYSSFVCSENVDKYWGGTSVSIEEAYHQKFENQINAISLLKSDLQDVSDFFDDRFPDNELQILNKSLDVARDWLNIFAKESPENEYSELIETYKYAFRISDSFLTVKDRFTFPDLLVKMVETVRKECARKVSMILLQEVLKIEKECFEKLNYPEVTNEQRIEIRKHIRHRLIDDILSGNESHRTSHQCRRLTLGDCIVIKKRFLWTELDSITGLALVNELDNLPKMSKSEFSTFRRAVSHEFHADYRFFQDDSLLFEVDPLRWSMDNIIYEVETFDLDDQSKLVFFEYGFGMGWASKFFIHVNKNSVYRLNIEKTRAAQEFLSERKIVTLNVGEIKEIGNGVVWMTAYGYIYEDSNCCATYTLLLETSIENNTLLVKNISVTKKRS